MPSSAPKTARAAMCGETSVRKSPAACPSCTIFAIASRYASELRRRELLHEARRLPEDDGDDLGEIALSFEEPELHVDDGAQARRARSAASGAVAHEREELAHAILEERDEQLLLRLEVEVDRSVGDAGGLGDLAHAGGVEAVPREDLHGGLEDAIALVARAALLRRVAILARARAAAGRMRAIRNPSASGRSLPAPRVAN